jgi:hypothetical protein
MKISAWRVSWRAADLARLRSLFVGGSSGAGGSLRTELQKELRRLAQAGTIRAFIAGEDWRVSDEATWDLLKKFPEWKQDSDLGKSNKGISIVFF